MSTKYWKRQGIPRVFLAALVVFGAPAFAAEGDSGGGATTFDLSGGGVLGAGDTTATAANTTVTNDALLDYDVGGVAQNQIAASDAGQGGAATFLVDRLVDVNVTRVGSTKSVGPGGTVGLTFDVTNESNDDTTALYLRAVQSTNDLDSLGTAQVTTASTVGTVCIDGNANGQCGDGGDTALTATGGVFELTAADNAPGTAVRIVVEVTTDLGAANGEYDTFVLAAGVGSGGAGNQFETDDNGRSVPGTAAGTDTADDPAVVENVFGDATGSDAVDISAGSIENAGTGGTPAGGADLDGQHSAQDQLQIAAAQLTVSKTSEVIYDPIEGLACDLATLNAGGTDYADCDTTTPVVTPNNLPGAIVRYTITVSNATGAAAAEDVTITDNLPPEVGTGNVEADSQLDSTVITCDGAAATGLAGNGGTCSGTPESYLDNMVITDCDGTISATALTDPISELVADTTGSAVTCDADESATIVYYVTIP